VRYLWAPVIAALFASAPVHADVKPLAARVGVDEHVGASVPTALRVTDEHGLHRTLGEFLTPGRPLLLYHCPGLCDISLRELATTLRDLNGFSLGADYRALTVSIDPHDSKDTANAKRSSVVALLHRRADPDWTFAVTDAASMSELSGVLGYRFDYDPATRQYAHPAVSVVLTPDGKVARYLYGPTLERRSVQLALREARLGRGGATALIDRTVMSCFRYDPATHRYSFLILGVMRIGAAFFALALAIAVFVFARRGRARHMST
jgi:protein SCO1/2